MLLLCMQTLTAEHVPTNLPFLQVDVMSLWLTFSSVMLAFVFVFGNSIQNMYEAVIFLFVVHPLDVGDVLMGQDGSWLQVRAQIIAPKLQPAQICRGSSAWHCVQSNSCEHSEMSIRQLQVEEMALQNLTLRRSDGVRIFYPITKLCKEPIFNISRSANRWEGFKVAATPQLRGLGTTDRICLQPDHSLLHTTSKISVAIYVPTHQACRSWWTSPHRLRRLRGWTWR